jgi:thiol-disulfide isomerase/thioredoxin
MPSKAKNPPGGSRQRSSQARRERATQLRQQQAKQDSRRRRTSATSTVAAVVAVIAALVIVKVIAGHSKPKSGSPTGLAPASVVQQVRAVPASVFATVGAGDAGTAPKKLSGQPVADTDGKPTVLYVGAEYCPYCATERWPLVVALSRFGTLSNLGATTSSPSDVYPNTATFSFHGATYTSPYLALDAKELQSNQVSNGQYTVLDKLNSAENADFKSGGRGYPYINLAGRYRVTTQYNPQVLQGKTMEQIAAALADPTSAVSKSVVGSANLITAGLCTLTNNQPANVCTAAPIPSLESQVGGG